MKLVVVAKVDGDCGRGCLVDDGWDFVLVSGLG